MQRVAGFLRFKANLGVAADGQISKRTFPRNGTNCFVLCSPAEVGWTNKRVSEADFPGCDSALAHACGIMILLDPPILVRAREPNARQHHRNIGAASRSELGASSFGAREGEQKQKLACDTP